MERPPFDALGRHLIEASTDCVKLIDRDGRVSYISPSGVALLGLCGPADLVGRQWIDVWENGERAAAADALSRAFAGDRTSFEGFCRIATGAGRWWEVAVTPFADEPGAMSHVLVVSRDITARRREADFRAGQHRVLEMIAGDAALDIVLDRLIRLVEDQTDGMRCSVLLLDDDGMHVRIASAPSLPDSYNRAIDGSPIGPMAGSCGAAMYHGRPVFSTDILTDPVWQPYRDLATAHGLRACWSTPILSTEHLVLGSFAMYCAEPRGPSPDELRLIEVAANISRIAIERLRAQEALRRSEARNRAILKAIPDWMFILSADGVFLDYHAKDPGKLLVPPSVFLGKTFRDILPTAVAGVLAGAFDRALASDEAHTVEYAIDAGPSQEFYEACAVRCDGDKVLSIVRDITDRKRAEMDAAIQHRELAHLSRVATLGELSGALAHELSQPLSAILMNAQAARRLLSSAVLDLAELRATLDDIIANDKRAGTVIERLRAFLKKGENLYEPLDVNDVARDVLDLAHGDLLARRVAVSTHLASPMPAVEGDRIQLQQVLLNLVLNACEAMTETERTRRVLTVTTAVDNGFVQMSFADRGIGIPVDQLDAVFQPFVTFRQQGLGLGLAISRSIVLAHGGRIHAENNAGGGSTFRCFLPVAKHGAATSSASDPIESGAAAS